MASTVSPDDALLALGPAESPFTLAAVYAQLAMAQLLTNPECLDHTQRQGEPVFP